MNNELKGAIFFRQLYNHSATSTIGSMETTKRRHILEQFPRDLPYQDILRLFSDLMTETEILLSRCINRTHTNYSGIRMLCFTIIADAHIPIEGRNLDRFLDILHIPPTILWEAFRCLQGVYHLPDAATLEEVINIVAAKLIVTAVQSYKITPALWN